MDDLFAEHRRLTTTAQEPSCEHLFIELRRLTTTAMQAALSENLLCDSQNPPCLYIYGGHNCSDRRREEMARELSDSN